MGVDCKLGHTLLATKGRDSGKINETMEILMSKFSHLKKIPEPADATVRHDISVF